MGRASTVLCALACAGTILAGCARQETQQHANVSTTRTVFENPSRFPLYPQSTVVDVVPVSSVQMFAAIRASDPEAELPANFRGHEVIAETTATMPQLTAWLHDLRAKPPAGLHTIVDTRGSEFHLSAKNDRDTAIAAHFEASGGTRTVYVVAGDPKRVRENLGPVFTLIENYNAVPGMLRGPIDEQAKKQIGYSVTEMLDVKSPVGAVVAQVKRMQNGGRRAILLIDESKAP